jgi:CRP-like cAMP-binding protein
MSRLTNDNNPVANRLLAALPRKEYERLLPGLETVQLAKGETIYNAGDTVRYVYFPAGAVVSLISMTQDGNTIEVALVGDEGVVGVSAVLGAKRTPYQAVVQVGGEALRIKADVLKEEFQHNETLQDMLLCYVYLLLTQVIQSAVCNHFHSAQQRLCRWLLLTSDRARTDSLPLTQEFISHMLGTPRTSVTAIAKELQDAGLISYSRGQITLLDRPGLEAAACECYQVVSRAFSAALR